MIRLIAKQLMVIINCVTIAKPLCICNGRQMSGKYNVTWSAEWHQSLRGEHVRPPSQCIDIGKPLTEALHHGKADRQEPPRLGVVAAELKRVEDHQRELKAACPVESNVWIVAGTVRLGHW